MNNSKLIIDELIKHGIIPENGQFEVTPSLIDKYRLVYGFVNNVTIFPETM